MLSSCALRKQDEGRDLSSYPIEFRAKVNFDGRDHEILYKQNGKERLDIEFLYPEDLSKLKLAYDNGSCTLYCGDITIPINDGGYASENGILLIRRLFEVTSRDFSGAETVKRSGVKYCIEKYSVNGSEIRLYFGEDENFPQIAEAEINGHKIEMVIVNE